MVERPGWSGSPSARATVTATSSASVIGARSTYHTPSPNSARHCGRDLDRQPGFAHPARTGQVTTRFCASSSPQLGQLRVAAHETGQLHRKISVQQRLSACEAAGTR